MAEQKASADHLVVLIHGLWGNPAHLNHLRDTLLARHPNGRLHVLVVKSNADYNTYDGIEVGGERIVHEIHQELAGLEAQDVHIRKISVIGYSLGGLLARYAIGLLYSGGLFDRLQPVNFTTFASPHIGVRTPHRSYRSKMWNFLGARTISTTGAQMFTTDSFRDTGKPLLAVMADPRSVFFKGLKQFKRKSLYANTMNDRSVPFFTAAFSRVDPFNDMSKITVNYLPKEGKGVLLDPTNPVTPKDLTKGHASLYQRLNSVSRGTLHSIPFYIFVCVSLPLAFPLFIINATYQTWVSSKRKALHESGKPFNLERYRVKLLEEVQVEADRVATHIAGHRPEEFLPTPPPELGSSPAEPARVGPFPTLALTADQFDMIDNLDTLGFVKYCSHIQKVRHTHAAVIVRMNKASFAEGRVVTTHWAKHFEA